MRICVLAVCHSCAVLRHSRASVLEHACLIAYLGRQKSIEANLDVFTFSSCCYPSQLPGQEVDLLYILGVHTSKDIQ